MIQKAIQISPKQRGFHLITKEIVHALPEITQFQIGMLHLFIQHTSASLTMNENYDPDVRKDMEMQLKKIVPDCQQGDDYTHTLEGPDDISAHIKSSLLGSFLMIPIQKGQLALGTWQGIYLGEHREHGGTRRIVATLF